MSVNTAKAIIFLSEAMNYIEADEEKLKSECGLQLALAYHKIKEELMAQLTSPVRWIDVESELHKKGYNHSIEPSEPAVLSNIKKRARGGVLIPISVAAGAAGGAVCS